MDDLVQKYLEEIKDLGSALLDDPADYEDVRKILERFRDELLGIVPQRLVRVL